MKGSAFTGTGEQAAAWAQAQLIHRPRAHVYVETVDSEWPDPSPLPVSERNLDPDHCNEDHPKCGIGSDCHCYRPTNHNGPHASQFAVWL